MTTMQIGALILLGSFVLFVIMRIPVCYSCHGYLAETDDRRSVLQLAGGSVFYPRRRDYDERRYIQ